MAQRTEKKRKKTARRTKVARIDFERRGKDEEGGKGGIGTTREERSISLADGATGEASVEQKGRRVKEYTHQE